MNYPVQVVHFACGHPRSYTKRDFDLRFGESESPSLKEPNIWESPEPCASCRTEAKRQAEAARGQELYYGMAGVFGGLR
jgi:hypothetical protein